MNNFWQTHHVHSILKRQGNGRFHVVSTCRDILNFRTNLICIITVSNTRNDNGETLDQRIFYIAIVKQKGIRNQSKEQTKLCIRVYNKVMCFFQLLGNNLFQMKNYQNKQQRGFITTTWFSLRFDPLIHKISK